MKKLLFSMPLIALLALLTGCGSVGNIRGQNTDVAVNLNNNNYKIVKVGAKGSDWGFWLLGLIPFASPTAAEAKASLYASMNQSLEGRSVALVNQTEDRSFNYYILFAVPKITFTADVIEFTKESK